MIVPLVPTAQPFEASVKDTPNRAAVVPLVCGDQVLPSAVCVTVPLPVPTAQPMGWAVAGVADARAAASDHTASCTRRLGRQSWVTWVFMVACFLGPSKNLEYGPNDKFSSGGPAAKTSTLGKP